MSRTYRPYAEIKAARQEFIRSRKQLLPTGACHMCGWNVPPKAHYCSTACAQDYQAEIKELLQE